MTVQVLKVFGPGRGKADRAPDRGGHRHALLRLEIFREIRTLPGRFPGPAAPFADASRVRRNFGAPLSLLKQRGALAK